MLRVLVVDDEPLIRWSLTDRLTELGHSVSEAGDGASALRALASAGTEIDVIVLDYRLPDASDLFLLKKIRALAPRSAVIMMTAFGTPEVTRHALNLGACRVVPKPFEVQDMAGFIEMAASERQ